MKTRQVGKGIVKGTLWGAATYATFAGGTAIRKVGEEILKKAPADPYLGIWLGMIGMGLYVVGDVVRYGAVVPAFGVGLNAIDVAAGVVDRQPKDDEKDDA